MAHRLFSQRRLLLVCPLVCTALIKHDARRHQSLSHASPLQTNTRGHALTDEEVVQMKLLAVKQDLDEIYHQHLLDHHIPGLIYGVTLHGKLVMHSGLGSVSVSPTARDGKVPCKDKSLFRIASMTKSFTAMAIVQLRDKGLLKLTDPVSKYVPEVSQVVPLSSDAPTLTIGHLLTMQGGFPQDDPWGDRLLDMSEDDFSKLLRSGLYMSNVIGTEYEYSNLGYAILGRVITNVTKMSYQQYITQNILKPLGMNKTIFEYSEGGRDVVQGYRWEESKWKEEPLLHDGTFGAMGGVITTLEDFAKYMKFHQSVWQPCESSKEESVLCPASVREMHFPWNMGGVFIEKPRLRHSQSDTGMKRNIVNAGEYAGVWAEAYGYGLKNCLDSKGVRWIRHAGGLPGFSSEWRFLPDHGVGLVVFSNGTYTSTPDANHAAMSYLLRNGVITPCPQVVDVLSIRSFQLLKCLQNDFCDEISNDIFASNFFLDKAKLLWSKETTNIRKILCDVDVVGKMEVKNHLRGHFVVTGKCGKTAKISFTMTPENPPRIQSLEMTVL